MNAEIKFDAVKEIPNSRADVTPSTNPNHASIIAESQQSRSLILIVDDTPVGRDTLESLLFSPSYELAFAEDGAEALKKAQELKPDLILLDVMMPGMDGFEVCRRIRANSELADIPILLVTALDDRQSKLRGIEAGADDFVTKPIDRAEMRARVRTITRLNRYRKMVDERARFAWVVDRAEDGYLLIDAQDRMLYANDTARRLLGIQPTASLEGLTFLDAARALYRCEPEINWSGWPAHQRTTNERHTASAETLYLIRPESSGSSVAWLQVSIFDQPGSVPPVQLVQLHDVTSEMVNRRDMFTFHSLVMHKLNTPLHLMLASMEMLRSDVDSNEYSEQTAELVELALGGAFRLRSVVDDILRFLSVPSLSDFSSNIQLRRLPALVEQITANMDLRPVTVKIDAPETARLVWSERVIEMVLSELLKNSLKFHPKHNPTIDLHVSAPQMPAGDNSTTPFITLQVRDDGATLTPSQIEHVWVPYYQAERYFTGEVPGMGLGLAIVASLVWEVNGHCRLYNRNDGPGIVVEMDLPLKLEE